MEFQKSFSMMLRILAIPCAIFAVFIFYGALTKPAYAESTASIRVIHASPYVGTVDVFVDGTKLLSNFQFGVVTKYAPLPAGPHKIQVALVGKGVNAAAITQTLSVAAGTAYTVAALGTKSTNLSLEIFKDDNTVVGNMAKVRIYHLAPDTSSADISISSNVVVSGLAYQQASQYFPLAAGSHTFNATIGSGSTAIPIPVTLEPWTITSIFAVGMLNGSPRLQFVSMQEAGLPGMPQTGSDPMPQPHDAQIHFFWPLALLIVAVLALLTVAINRTVYRRS